LHDFADYTEQVLINMNSAQSVSSMKSVFRCRGASSCEVRRFVCDRPGTGRVGTPICRFRRLHRKDFARNEFGAIGVIDEIGVSVPRRTQL